MPTEEVNDVTDGDHLILEGAMAGRYHIVDRHSPRAGDDYAELCQYLPTLSGLDVMKTWRKYREFSPNTTGPGSRQSRSGP